MSKPTSSWRGRTALVTGHTGFKGSWLCHWLHQLGCEIHGFSLEPPTQPNMFTVTRVSHVLASDIRGDLREMHVLQNAMSSAEPDVVFHLAAQPLVREGYRDPLGTFATNVLGTANVLEAARHTPSVKAVVIVTTDKVYENKETLHPYREADPLGGYDPYSASKAAAEIATASYRSSFFCGSGAARVATVRAGNVIGGGDWAKDRLIPDCLAAFAAETPVKLRYPRAVRPWQHVLEPLSGYLALAEKLLDETTTGFDRAWNFGPDQSGDGGVGAVAKLAAEIWGPPAEVQFDEHAGAQPHEAGLLRLDSALARTSLAWKPRWNLREAIEQTVAWQRAWLRGDDMTATTLSQIDLYNAALPT